MASSKQGAVSMWHEERGEGEPLVLLHPGGAGVDSRAFGSVLDGLSQRFRLYTPDRRGHGHTGDVDGPITYELMAEDTVAFLDAVVGGPVFLLGYSDGAVVALLVALRRPDLVRQLVFIAGVFQRDAWAQHLDSDEAPPDFLRASYAEVSPDGPDHFDVIVAKLAAEHSLEPSLTPRDLKTIANRTLIMVADDDEVPLEHAVEMYRSMPNAELAIVPGTSHGLLVEKPDLCNETILQFLTRSPVPLMAPIRREGQQ